MTRFVVIQVKDGRSVFLGWRADPTAAADVARTARKCGGSGSVFVLDRGSTAPSQGPPAAKEAPLLECVCCGRMGPRRTHVPGCPLGGDFGGPEDA